MIKTDIGEVKAVQRDSANLLVSINDTVTVAMPAKGPTFRQLPPRPRGFVGRETALAALRATNHTNGIVITGVRGIGGVGKTALALVLAHEWESRFPDAQLFLDGRGTRPNPPGAGDLLAQVILAFHPTSKLPNDEATLKSMYHDVLQRKKALILLDNARDAAQAAPLMPPDGCALIVTSRQNFMIGTRPAHSIDRLPDAEAVALLSAFYPDLTDSDAAELVKLCAGLPLALRLAGSHLALDGSDEEEADVTGYLKNLRESGLGTLDAEAPDTGEIIISEILRFSEARLSEPERHVWRNLGVFTASFDGRAAKAVAGAEGIMLNHFVRRSLLERDGGDRCKLHDLASDYACSQLSDATYAGLQLAHARHYAEIARVADILYQTKGKRTDSLALFDRERVHLEAAYAWLAARNDEAAAGQILALVDAVVCSGPELRVHPCQRVAWLESQLRAARLVKDRHHEGTALGNLGLAYAASGDARKAIEFYEPSLSIAREVRDRRGEVSALNNLGRVHADLGNARKAISFFEQALAVFKKIGDRLGEGTALGSLGLAHADLGEARKAIGYYEQTLVIHRETGDRLGESKDLNNLGLAHRRLGDARKAVECFEQALVITREIGDRRGEGIGLWNTALAHNQLGNLAGAITHAKEALSIFEAIEDANAAKVRATLAEWSGPARQL